MRRICRHKGQAQIVLTLYDPLLGMQPRLVDLFPAGFFPNSADPNLNVLRQRLSRGVFDC
jgi:hypothetical protein